MPKIKPLTAALLVLGAALIAPSFAQTDPDRLRQQLRRLLPQASPQAATAGFQFDGFRLAPGSGDATNWFASLTSGQAIGANAYVVRSALLSRTGATLSTGEDIRLPATGTDRAVSLTRGFRLQPDLASLRLEVVDRASGQVVHMQSFPLEGDALATLEPARPGRSSGSTPVTPTRDLPQAGEVAVALRLLPDDQSFEIRNTGTAYLRVDEVRVHYRLPGMDGSARSRCAQTQLPPGQATTCTLAESRLGCSSLKAIDVEMQLNGQRWQVRMPFEPMARRIGSKPRIELERQPAASGVRGSGMIGVAVTGQYVRPGTRVVVKGLVTLDDQQRFPSSFLLDQSANEINGWLNVASPVEDRPMRRLCFHVQEITTDDSLYCGGVGVLLYRNEDKGRIPSTPFEGNIFVHNQVCN